MLRTTQESLEETQPLANEDETLVLVLDGWLSNWEELRAELLAKGARLRSRADAELVLRAYEAWGKDCLARLDGDFALAVWDARKRLAFCARDRFGNKPFNYHWDGKALVFASDLGPVLDNHRVPRIANLGMVAEYLTGKFYLRDETLWARVMRLTAAHQMEVGIDGPRIAEYWKPALNKALPHSKDADYFDHYLHLFADCVRRCSRSHRAVAYEVSGGLDSSAIFCVADKLMKSATLPAPGISGFTCSFEDTSAANELNYARAVADHLGIPIHEVAPSRWPLSWFKEQANAMRDFPGFPNEAMFNGMLQHAAAAGSRVLLTGEGGDQWLEGSRTYYAEALSAGHWISLFSDFRRDAALFGLRTALRWMAQFGILRILPINYQNGLRRLVQSIRRDDHRLGFFWLKESMLNCMVKRRSKAEATYVRQSCREGQRELYEDMYHPARDHVIERLERAAARYGIEKRHPLRCVSFAQFALDTPERLRMRGDRNRFIHVEALRDVLPKIVTERRNKAEFSVMFREKLVNARTLMVETIPNARADWVIREGVERLFQLYQDNPNMSGLMWLLWGLFGCYSVDLRQDT
jgi:asparagine synthase (glutamine-hydrolysing)